MATTKAQLQALRPGDELTWQDPNNKNNVIEGPIREIDLSNLFRNVAVVTWEDGRGAEAFIIDLYIGGLPW